MSLLLDSEEETNCLELTFTQRIMGFAGTAVIGLFSGILSIFAIGLLRIRKFSILFTVFNLMLISSTGFLIGFKRQFNSLFSKKRIFATIGMFAGMLITIIFALKFRSLFGAIIGFLIEGVSFAYYALSYLPYGKEIFSKLFI